MMLQTLAIAAAGLSAASAFLLPPEIKAFPPGFPIESLLHEGNRTLFLDCPGCPVPLAEDGGKIQLATGVKSHLELVFRIDNSGKHPRLVANDFELFPHPDPRHNNLVAKHAPEVKQGDSYYLNFEDAVPVTLGASLGWKRQPTSRKTQMSHIVVDLQIIEIMSGFQDGIPNVKIHLIHCGHSGRLRIAKIHQTESTALMHVPLRQQLAQCGDNMFCKVRAVMLDKFRKMAGHMGGRKGCKTHGHHAGGHSGHHMGGMGGHHGHKMPSVASKPHFKLREHSWSQLWNKFAHHILFPIGVGIVAGVTVSIVGMVVGTLLVGLWRVFVRGQPFFHRRRAHRRHSKSAAAEEKAALMANVEEEAPAYRDEEPKENN